METLIMRWSLLDSSVLTPVKSKANTSNSNLTEFKLQMGPSWPSPSGISQVIACCNTMCFWAILSSLRAWFYNFSESNLGYLWIWTWRYFWANNYAKNGVCWSAGKSCDLLWAPVAWEISPALLSESLISLRLLSLGNQNENTFSLPNKDLENLDYLQISTEVLSFQRCFHDHPIYIGASMTTPLHLYHMTFKKYST